MKITDVYVIVRFCYTAHCIAQSLFYKYCFGKSPLIIFYASTVKHNENGNKQGEINSSVLKL